MGGSWVLRYYPPAAQHKFGFPWVGPNQVIRQATSHTVGIQRDQQKPIVFVHDTQYDAKAVNRKFPGGSWVLRYYPPAAQHKFGFPWVGPNQVIRQATSHTVGIQRDQQKPIVFVRADEHKLCPTPTEAKWSPDISTVKSLFASTVAFRPGSQVSDVTSTPSVDVSEWGGMDSHHSRQTTVGDLDRPVDLSGHVLSPFFVRNMDYMDCRFHSIAHLMCYRYAVANNQRTSATGIRKWANI